jgi:hypothetical protein
LPESLKVITNKSQPEVAYTQYPIQVDNINLFLKGTYSRAVSVTMGITKGAIEAANKLTIPTVVILMVVYMPSALGLQKSI